MLYPAAKVGSRRQQECGVEQPGAARIVRARAGIVLDLEQRTVAYAQDDIRTTARQFFKADHRAVVSGKLFGVLRLQADAGNADRRRGGKWQFAHVLLRSAYASPRSQSEQSGSADKMTSCELQKLIP
jgi:hypothetical protein